MAREPLPNIMAVNSSPAHTGPLVLRGMGLATRRVLSASTNYFRLSPILILGAVKFKSNTLECDSHINI